VTDSMATGRPLDQPFVFITVGTDYHPFDRLVRWVDDWLVTRSCEPPVRCLVQHGSAARPRVAEGVEIVSFDRVLEYTRRATAVVCQAGPASVALTRRQGLKPIVVARAPEHGEHVDDHQVVFAQRLDEEGRGIAVWSSQELSSALDSAVSDPARLRMDRAEEDETSETVTRFAEIANELMARRSAKSPIGVP
jgi:UDP-N-acetylglucosamine transferase subunit ALG13